jgi:4-hydroxy-tetrahydrodipicolinate reductase
MGKEVLAAVRRQADMTVVGTVSRAPSADTLRLPDGTEVPWLADLGALIGAAEPEVVVDFTNAAATLAFARVALPRGVAMVIGTSGLTPSDVEEMRRLCQQHGVGTVIGPNMGLAGVLMMHLCKVAAPFFEYAEIVEMHREGKVDAPSGTSLALARQMVEARGKPFAHNVPERETLAGTRGGEIGGVAIHSVRSPGAVGVHEVLLGGPGESLTIRHDSLTRESFTPGVLLAIREVVKRKELVYGLESLLGLA